MARPPFPLISDVAATNDALFDQALFNATGNPPFVIGTPQTTETRIADFAFAPTPPGQVAGVAGGFFEAEVARLNQLGNFLATPPQPKTPSPPRVVADQTGATNVFRSISVVDQYVLEAAQGIARLRETLRPATASGDDAGTLLRALEDYLDDYMTGDAINDVFPDRAEDLATYFPQDHTRSDVNPRPVFARVAFNDAVLDRITASTSSTPGPADDLSGQLQALHTNLFDAGRVIMDDARVVQRLRHGLARLRRLRARQLERRRETAAELRREIAAARRRLATLNGARQEALGDAQAAQALAAENWAETEAAFDTRRRTLEQNEGLAYVRVRETPIAAAFADPLPLRPDTGGRFPWEGRIDAELPQALDPFFEVVAEIPIKDWSVLARRLHLLPAPIQLQAMARRRTARLSALTAAPVASQPGILVQRLAPIQTLARSALSDLAGRRVAPALSIRGQQDNAADALSLADLITGGPHRLRSEAAAHRDALEQAILGLLGLLRSVSPGVRLAWGEAAENDTLAVREPGRWPALESERDSRFNTLRSVFDVVDWWFDQLEPRAAAASQTAMASLMRAVLMLAADDDPAEILQGTVQVAPGRLNLGTPLRLLLNRRARPGAMLHLMDPSHVVVGLLRVDDEDAQGTTATVTQTLAPSVTVDTRFTVVERRLALWD